MREENFLSEIINFEQVTQWLEEYQKIDSQKQKDQLQNLIAITCMPLVKKVARTLARRSTDPVEDIIQVGSCLLYTSPSPRD